MLHRTDRKAVVLNTAVSLKTPVQEPSENSGVRVGQTDTDMLYVTVSICPIFTLHELYWVIINP
jgi:hypothetical protein